MRHRWKLTSQQILATDTHTYTQMCTQMLCESEEVWKEKKQKEEDRQTNFKTLSSTKC